MTAVEPAPDPHGGEKKRCQVEAANQLNFLSPLPTGEQVLLLLRRHRPLVFALACMARMLLRSASFLALEFCGRPERLTRAGGSAFECL